MDRLLACLVLLLACSDDGVPAGGTDAADEGGSGSVSATGAMTSGDDATPTTGQGTTDEDPSGGLRADLGGSTTGGGPATGTPCESNDDCVLVDDCCSCTAIHIDAEAPMCEDTTCEVGMCEASSIPGIGVECRFGSCELERVDCNPLIVACDEKPPRCADGTLPSVVDGCWGPCIPAEACDVVGSCDDCPADEACVQTSTDVAPFYSCEPIDPSCEGTPDCTCMAGLCEDPYICEMPGGGGADLTCGCPVCG